MSIYWHAIVYAGMWVLAIQNYGIPPGTPVILCFHYYVLYHLPLNDVLFVYDTNTTYVATYATENILTKAHQCSQTYRNYGV